MKIMEKEIIKYRDLLNNREPEKRLNNLRSILEMEKAENLSRKQMDYYINNHIHTTFSFSCYTPAMSIWMAFRSGLQTAGIMDHDTISGAREFMMAGEIAGIPITKGVECRADFSKTLLRGRKINNPDQRSIAYIAIHGVPDNQIDRINSFFTPYREERNKRNLLMVKRLNKILEPFSLSLDFGQDVLPLSYAPQGGTVTERHILFTLARKIMEKFSKGREVIECLQHKLKVEISKKNLAYLEDKKNGFYAYDILNVLKSDLIELFYVDATTECPDVKDVLALSDETGSISAYAYLGDVTDSVTGDKKAQKFEDAYLELLFDVIKELGFKAVTYIPTRNSMVQIKRIQRFCERYGFFQISGEDINSPRQSFICEFLKKKELHNLVDSAWALVGHEKMAKEDEILAHVICDSTCMSSYKAAEQGADHKRVPSDIGENPVIIGHEFSGNIIEVGRKWQKQFSPGDRFSIQPALNYKGSLDAPGYSYRYIGGDATYIIIPNEVMECRCLLKYNGEGYFPASLSEPMSCIVGTFNASYHTTPGSYIHHMGIKKGGNMALLSSAGPIGVEAVDYAIHSEYRPLLLVVTDIDEKHLHWAENIFPPRDAEKNGVKLVYINPLKVSDIKTHLLKYTKGKGFDDGFIFHPIGSFIELE